MTEERVEQIEDVLPIRVVLEGFRWVIDYGGGITRRVADRDEALALAESAAATENRTLDVAA